MTTTHDACNAIRNCTPRNHDELITMFAVVAAMVKQSNVLSSSAQAVVLDFIDSEIRGQIEQDQIDEQQEAAWSQRQDLPGFAGTYASLGALNLPRVAA